MFQEHATLLRDAGLIIGTILLGWLLGVIIEKYVVSRIHRMSRATKTRIDDIIVKSIHNLIPLWLVLALIAFILSLTSFESHIISYANRVILVIFMYSGIVVAARMAGEFVKEYMRSFEDVLPPSTLLINVTKISVYIVGILMILHTLGISIAPILTALGVTSLAVALALQDTLSNLFSGIQIIVARQLRPGDYIRLEDGLEGYIEDITWRNTIIRALSNNLIIIPNSKLAQSTIINHYKPDTQLNFPVEVGVSYDTDLKKAEKVAIEEAKKLLSEVEGGVADFEPFVRFYEFGDSSINMKVFLRAKEYAYQFRLKHEFIKRLKERFDAEGIEIPFPIRTVYLKNGLQPPDEA